MTPRDYQEKAIQHPFDVWAKGQKSTALILATGLGKTICFAHILSRVAPKRTLVLAHRKELIEQAKDKIERSVGLDCSVEMAWERAEEDLFKRKPVIIATVQTLNSGNRTKRMERFNPMDFGLVVIDEAHHATADTYRRVLEYFGRNPELKVLGVTATPDRTDEEALAEIFGQPDTWFQYDILDGCNDGWLVPITQLRCEVSSLDFSHVRTTAGDLNEGDLAKIMEAEENIQGVCHPTLEVLYGLPGKTLSTIPVPQWTEHLCGLGRTPRRAIVFTVSVAQAEACANILNRVVPGIAEWVCGKTPTEDREATLARFANGRTAVVVNCGVLTEGYDNPGVEVIIMARPTKSRSLYTQMIGRSTRPLPGLVDAMVTADGRKGAIEHSLKPRCRVVDFAGNSGRHKLICCMDVLSGKSSSEAVERAIEEAKAAWDIGKAVTVTRRLEGAELKLRLEQEEASKKARLAREAQKSKVVAKADFEQMEVDPFGKAKGAAWTKHQKPFDPCSPNQARVLGNAGINPVTVSWKQAHFYIGILKANDWKLPEKYEWIRDKHNGKATA